MSFEWSKYQSNIFNWVENNEGENLVGEACAGSGKTTVLVELFNRIPQDIDSLFLAFNKHIQTELNTRLPKNAICKTYHACGLNVISQNEGRVRVDKNKVDKILDAGILSKEYYRYLYYPVKRLVGLCKGNLLEPTRDTLEDLTSYHGIDLQDEKNRAFDAVAKVMEVSKKERSSVDFDDMCWLPVALNMPAKTYDFIAVDEVQDTNRVQLELAMMLQNGHTRTVGIGDRYQSIYGFRGADVDAIPNLIERLNADQLPLSISYRAPNSVVELVNKLFPHIPFEAAPTAIDGSVETVEPFEFLSQVKQGDMILCRTNAPMIAPVFSLIRQGKKAIIVGRDIGKNLKNMIEKVGKKALNSYDLGQVLVALEDYCENEIWKLTQRKKEMQAELMRDKMLTIMAISDGCSTVNEVYRRIDEIFSDEIEGIAFSTVHKAKGLEAKNVYILHPELLPHPMAKKDWEKQQEQNIKYVAFTRALVNLRFIVEER